VNERNVQAIAAILVRYLPEGPESERRAELLAVALASRGVLMPSTLTDAEWEHALMEGTGGYDMEFYLDRGVQALERIAKGETNGV
jgi:hypothetical protein